MDRQKVGGRFFCPCNARRYAGLLAGDKGIHKMIHKHIFTNEITVSGYGLTEYKIKFCKKCGKVFWRLTTDYDNLYPKLVKKEKQWLNS